jgi:lambda repressor-like predicted transcriptional regulator
VTSHAEARGGSRATKSAASKPRSFGAIVRDLLIERDFVTGMGNPNWSGFAAQLDGVNYESLRKAVTGERHPAPKIMEAVASSLGVDPSIFWEYQLYEAQKQFDPKVVGDEAALANLQAWQDAAR